ncbi:hypothetical protein Acid345_3147 [Candidatus Koribacter versatilis Ellin345]|uniref:O-antigen polymerase n=1 Tax=Koribacter versatilis (strain Ellin345) TaxID=204669 RepID=Q1ILV2_KORVE|nr:O-antigen ligase family protein [Candidatus Koribacter versatilis]ABF42148.1 hypothetical protein Acid345_3147 [Candidatus Koribacter versatilis Ellin345]
MIAIYYIACVLIALSLCTLAFNNQDKFTFLAAFLLPFQGIGVEIGVLLNFEKIIAVLFVVTALMFYRARTARQTWFYAFAVLLGYMFTLTLIMFVGGGLDLQINHAMNAGWGTAQTTFRLPVQIASQGFTWMLLPTACLLAIRPSCVIYGFVWGNVCNALFGFYQVLAAVFGLPWLPEEILTKLSGENGGQFQVQHTDLFRLSGLAGEPKHAAAAFVFAILILMWFPVEGKKWKISVLGVALVLTLSTSGWVAFFVAFALTMLYRKKMVPFLVAGTLLLVIGVGYVVSDQVNFIVNDRVLLRLADPSSFEYKDSAILDVAREDPEILITGVGAGGIDFYLMRWVREDQLERGSVSPTYIGTEILGDYGLIGIVLFGFLLYKIGGQFDPNMRAFYVATIPVLVLLPRGVSLPAVLLLWGSLLAWNRPQLQSAFEAPGGSRQRVARTTA